MKVKSIVLTLFSLLFLCSCEVSEGLQAIGSLDQRIEEIKRRLTLKLSQHSFGSTSVLFCFKRVRLKAANDTTQDLRFELEDIEISEQGTYLSSIEVPDGTYERVEFKFDNHCQNGKSVEIRNAFGSFSTSEEVTLRFEGRILVNQDQVLSLNTEGIMEQLERYNNGNSGVKVKIEGLTGSF
ncbi:MAG: hypothetical protein ACO20H_09680 [Bacteriovoracaceae bacterium]